MYLKVRDIYPNNASPKVSPDADIHTVIIEMTSKLLGVTAVTNEENELLGIITDGDLRRMLNKQTDFLTLTAKDIMTVNPKTIGPDDYAVTALSLMEEKSITQLVVVEDNIVLGIVHLHDLLKEGLL
jgi:arabinose-5-phosphate isomerase